MLAALVLGLGLGALVAAQVGPVWLMVARTSLRYGVVPGAALGLGAALVDAAYATLGAAGAAPLLAVPPVTLGLGLGGAVLLVVLGVRTVRASRRVPSPSRGADEDAGLGAGTGETPPTARTDVATAPLARPLPALRWGLAATAANPLTIASWAAVFAAASTARFADEPTTAVMVVAGIAVGSLAAQLAVAGVMATLGRRVSTRTLTVVDVCSGLGLVGFGLLLAVRVLLA